MAVTILPAQPARRWTTPSSAATNSSGLRVGEAGDRHARGRAGHVVEPDLVADRHRGRIAAVLAADAELEVLARVAAALGRDLHQFAHALAVDRDERVDRQDALGGVEAQ